jgi:hypothetical protein
MIDKISPWNISSFLCKIFISCSAFDNFGQIDFFGFLHFASLQNWRLCTVRTGLAAVQNILSIFRDLLWAGSSRQLFPFHQFSETFFELVHHASFFHFIYFPRPSWFITPAFLNPSFTIRWSTIYLVISTYACLPSRVSFQFSLIHSSEVVLCNACFITNIVYYYIFKLGRQSSLLVFVDPFSIILGV